MGMVASKLIEALAVTEAASNILLIMIVVKDGLLQCQVNISYLLGVDRCDP